MIGHVKGRVVALDLLQCHRLRVPHILDFLRIALLDVNVSSCRCVEVNRGGRSQGVERDSVVLCQDRDTGGADLVGKIAVCRNAVAADEYRVHPALLHDDGCHVVADQSHIDACLLKLIGGQSCTLKERSCLVGKHVQLHALLRCIVDRSRCRAVAKAGKIACIAVCQNAVAVLDERCAVLCNSSGHLGILFLDCLCFLSKELYNLCHRLVAVVFHYLDLTLQRPGQVHCRRAGAVQVVRLLPELLQKLRIRQLLIALCQHVHGISGKNTDRRCSSYLQQLDGLPRHLFLMNSQILLVIGKSCLVQDDDILLIVRQLDDVETPLVLTAHFALPSSFCNCSVTL